MDAHQHCIPRKPHSPFEQVPMGCTPMAPRARAFPRCDACHAHKSNSSATAAAQALPPTPPPPPTSESNPKNGNRAAEAAEPLWCPRAGRQEDLDGMCVVCSARGGRPSASIGDDGLTQSLSCNERHVSKPCSWPGRICRGSVNVGGSSREKQCSPQPQPQPFLPPHNGSWVLAIFLTPDLSCVVVVGACGSPHHPRPA